MRKQIDFIYGQFIRKELKKGDILEIPFKATKDQQLGSISIVAKAKEYAVKVVECVIPGGVIEGYEDSWDLKWGNPQPPAVAEPQIRIGWYDINKPLNLKAGEVFMIVKVEVLHDLPGNFEVSLEMVDMIEVNAYDHQMPTPQIIRGMTIEIDPIKNIAMSVAKSKAVMGYQTADLCSNCKYHVGNKCGIGSYVVAAKGWCPIHENRA